MTLNTPKTGSKYYSRDLFVLPCIALTLTVVLQVDDERVAEELFREQVGNNIIIICYIIKYKGCPKKKFSDRIQMCRFRTIDLIYPIIYSNAGGQLGQQGRQRAHQRARQRGRLHKRGGARPTPSRSPSHPAYKRGAIFLEPKRGGDKRPGPKVRNRRQAYPKREFQLKT